MPRKFRLWQIWLCPASHAGQDPPRRQRHNDYFVSQGEIIYTGAQLVNAGRHLMPHYQGHRDARVHRAVKYMQVGAADAAMRNFQLNFASAGFDQFGGADAYRSVTFVKGCQLSSCIPLALSAADIVWRDDLSLPSAIKARLQCRYCASGCAIYWIFSDSASIAALRSWARIASRIRLCSR